MTWGEIDWRVLERHRERFLDGQPSGGPYWSSLSDLASYDLTFGERIGWKWDAVIAELKLRGWRPPGGPLLDWGCGSGVAGRRVVEAFGAGSFSEFRVWDHSELAVSFASEAARKQFPGLPASGATPSFLHSPEPIGLLVISHVLNELPASAKDEIRRLMARSKAVLWTEPGSHEVSRELGAFRDGAPGGLRPVAPCTHSGKCPILMGGNERHWCHAFAPPPSAIYGDPDWVRFGQRMGIDLRSLPYAFIALDRKIVPSGGGLSRLIGRPEHFKPYARVLNCDADGLAEITLMKRANPGLYKELEKTKRPLVYRWTKDGNEITGGAALSQPSDSADS
jgi:hypothetical protein